MIGVADIRQRIAKGVSDQLEAAGWRESTRVVDLFGQDARSLVHLAFAVGVLGTVPHALDRQSSRGGTSIRGAVVATGVVVRWAHRLRTDAHVEDYDAALVAQEALVAAVLAVDANPELGVRLLQLRRPEVAGDGTYLLGSVEFEVVHRLRLEAA